MTNSDCLLLKSILEDKAFRPAIEAALEEEVVKRTDELRVAVRNGNAIESARVGSAIDTLEGLVKILEGYAAQYRREG